MNSPQRLTILASFFAVAMLSGCTRGTNLHIVNKSTFELTKVVATGSGFTELIASIPAGEQRSVYLDLGGESSVKLDFDANGKHHTSGPKGYFEGGKVVDTKVTATVYPDCTVTVDDK
jgi:hypothetical protein